MSNTLHTFAQSMIPAVEHEMRLVLRADEADGDPLFAMMHYHLGWVDAQFRPTPGNGGKRIRPLLCLLSCQAAGGDWRQAVPAAAAVELLHNFTLIHDDIQDSSPTRRGRPTVWRLWGAPQAINAGDAMYALSHLAMSRLADSRGEATGQDLRILSEHTLPVASPVPAPIVVQALRRFDETCVHLTQGQYADMEFETRLDVGVEEYLTMIEGKTAALVGLAAELGALVAGQPPAVVSHYAAFGRDLGLAFQVKDDILGIWGEEELIGKSAATDIATGKKTLPVLYGLAHSERLRALYDRSESDEQFVGAAVALLDAVGARAFADGHASAYSESALDHLAAAKAQGPAHAALHELAHQLLYRKS